MHALQERFQTLLDFLLPPSCVVCKNSAAWLCESCFSKIRFISPPVCERCGTPTSASSSSFCRQCQNNPLRDIDGIRAASYFDNNPIRPVIHCLKYGNHKAVTADLGRILADAYHRYNLTAEVIVPVPLHASRFKERGYNQSELLASKLGGLLDLPVNARTLQRVRKTKSQMTLGADKRHENVADAFACCNEALLGQTVLLIDDVCTTGSTLNACAHALKQSGVSSVWGLTLAKAH